MPQPPSHSLLHETLRAVARRYRLPAMADGLPPEQDARPATVLAMAIEQARRAMVRGAPPDSALEHRFVEALAQMIREAMREGGGDPAFQAMVLRHRAAPVREYASLSAHADQDRRRVRATANAIAHAGLRRIPPGERREALARLHASTPSASWPELCDTARRLLAMPETADEPPFEQSLARLLESPELARLLRLDALAADPLVRRYRSLRDRHAPRSGSPTAVAQGAAGQRRGAAVETLAAEALDALARRLNEAEGSSPAPGVAPYRVVTSMRVPASLSAHRERAKSEWDAVLLRQAQAGDAAPSWDVCLLVEAKASVDAATTDLPRLLRGLRLLAQAREDTVYTFQTQQGEVRLRGASLAALPVDEAGLPDTVLYCCDAPAEPQPRLLGAATRMQLLSAPASLAYASALADEQPAAARDLEPVWHELLESQRWTAVLHQHPTLRQVRELMVNIDDLRAAIGGRAENGMIAGCRSLKK